MMRWWVLCLAIFSLSSSCSRREQPAPEKTPSAVSPSAQAGQPGATPPARRTDAEGLEMLERFECGRCHNGLPISPPSTDKRCVGCHQQIVGGAFPVEPATLKRWQQRITHFTAVPSLSGASRLERGWLTKFLKRPVDVRPALSESMPRLELSDADVDAIVDILSPRAEAVDPVLRERLKAVPWQDGVPIYERLGCKQCHDYAGQVVVQRAAGPELVSDAVRLAPDLSLVRSRMTPETLRRWLKDPKAFAPDTLMPTPELSERDLIPLLSFLLSSPLPALPEPESIARLPVLTRPVAFAEVERRVFKDTCWHCHAEPSFALGDGGPGNTGGFGFLGKGVNLSSYENVLGGFIDAGGHRRSLFRGDPGRLLRTLLARHEEERGAYDSKVRGMPLGLPALSLEDIQVVESWIAQGRPR